jgi:hypothetical protein
MTIIWIYLVLMLQIYSAQTSKVNVINMSDWTVNSETKETTYLSEKQEKKIVAISLTQMTWHSSADLTQCYLVLC